MEQGNAKNLRHRLAAIITVIFHPLLMPLYGLLVIFFAPTLFWYIPFRVKEILFFIFLVNNVLIPLSLMPFFRHRNIISSWMMEERTERVVPLLVSTVLYCVTAYLMYRLQVQLFLKAFSYSLAILSAVVFAINTRWKISVYASAAGAMTALVVILSLRTAAPLPAQLAFVLISSGLVLSSRLLLDRHDQGQVYGGFFTGLLVYGVSLLLLQ